MWLSEGGGCLPGRGNSMCTALFKEGSGSNVPGVISISGRVLGHEVRELAGDRRQNLEHLRGHCKNLGYYSERSGEPLEGPGLRNDMI